MSALFYCKMQSGQAAETMDSWKTRIKMECRLDCTVMKYLGEAVWTNAKLNNKN